MTKLQQIESRIEELKQDCWNMSMKDMEQKYETSYSTIKQILRKYNLTSRSKLIKYKYFREHEEEFLKDWTDGILNKKELEEKYKCPYKTLTVYTSNLKITRKRKKSERIGEEIYNKNKELMKIVEYNNTDNIIVEFQDEYKGRVHTAYSCFKNGEVRNPYQRSVHGIGIIGCKYSASLQGSRSTKEYDAWSGMLRRCYDEKTKEKNPSYQDVTCCDEWLLYENFYEWIHSQENFDKWFDGEKWAIDKDILVKGNKIYSPETCCLVPAYLNSLFVKNNANRGDYPIGVTKNRKDGRYEALTIYGKNNHKSKSTAYRYPTPEEAFYLGYKPSKEAYIKQVAQEEFDKGNITIKCYEAMMNYEVEITD